MEQPVILTVNVIINSKKYIYIIFPQGDFREDNFNTAMQVLRDAGDSGGSGGGKWDPRGRKGGTKGLFVSNLKDSVG